MMTSAIHGDARSTATSAISAVVTSSLSAVVSRKAPSRVRDAPAPGQAAVDPVGGRGDEEDGRRGRVGPVEDERHHHRREQDPDARAGGEQSGRAQNAHGAGLHGREGTSGGLRTSPATRNGRRPVI